MRLRAYFRIEPIDSPGASALAYVPFVIFSRGLAFMRMLLVARILGDANQREYGIYRPALEFMNPLVVLLMFGAADVAERYISLIEREHGLTRARRWLGRQYLRLVISGVALGAVLVAAARPVSWFIWRMTDGGGRLLGACAVTIVLLALYQHVAAVLRGLRAYAAAAGMEVLSAILLLGGSVAAAELPGARQAFWLIVAYALSLVAPVGVYGLVVWLHLRTPGGTRVLPAHAEPVALPRMTGFAGWSLVRLLLVMVFGFLSIWGVGFIAAGREDGAEHQEAVASYALPLTIAQLLGYVALTLWSSAYGIAAREWSHGRRNRARVQLFRTGRRGALLMMVLAVALLLSRGGLAMALPVSYHEGIRALLPGMLALFCWYALLAFASTYGDLQEKPYKGAMLWGVAVGVQVAGIVWARSVQLPESAGGWMLAVSAVGLGLALVLAPLVVCRPVRMTAVSMPLVMLAVGAASLFAPAGVVNYVAGPVLIGGAVLARWWTRRV